MQKIKINLNTKIIFKLLFLGVLLSIRLDYNHNTVAAEEPVTEAARQVKKMGLYSNELLSSATLNFRLLNEKDILVLDARSKKSYDQGHIRGAKLPLTQDYYRAEEMFRKGIIAKMPDQGLALEENLRKYEKDTPIVTYCSTDCHASAVLLFKLKKLGYSNVLALEDGYQAWENAGYAVESTK